MKVIENSFMMTDKDKVLLCPEYIAHKATICVYPKNIGNECQDLLFLYNEIIDIISKHERIYVITDDEGSITKNENVIPIFIKGNNIWIRDYAPLWALEKNKLLAITFRYQKAKNIDSNFENIVNKKLIDMLSVNEMKLDISLEGGNICLYKKTLYMCKNTIGSNRAYIKHVERILMDKLAIKKVKWQKAGKIDICKHIDNCLFANKSGIVKFKRNNSLDFKSNIYYFNGGVLLSKRYANDKKYLSIIKRNFPQNKIYFVDIEPITRLHGGLHCILKEIPRIP